jgi:hypothetical protein
VAKLNENEENAMKAKQEIICLNPIFFNEIYKLHIGAGLMIFKVKTFASIDPMDF